MSKHSSKYASKHVLLAVFQRLLGFPPREWLVGYTRSDFRADALAGIVIFVMLIPQGMAYAMIAGLPPQMGLYASAIPLIIFALFSTGRHLAAGPVAMVSILVFSSVSVIAEPGSTEYISYVLLLTLLVGLIQWVLGIFQVGFLVRFISKAVISGFTSAAAIIIALSQLQHILGFRLEASEYIFLLVIEAVTRLGETNMYALFIGLGGIVLMVVIKRLSPLIPSALIAVIMSTLLVYVFNLHEKGVHIVGHIPSGLEFSLPVINLQSVQTLLPMALTIALIGYVESIAIARALAAKSKYSVDPNQELKAIGLSNITAAFTSAYPVAGSFSRSAVNYHSGGRTHVASLITAVFMIVTLLYFTSLFYYLPTTILAAIIMVSVFGLIDVKEIKHFFRIKKSDGWILVVTAVTTLLIGIKMGILIGVIFSMLIFIRRSASPHIAELGYLAGERVFRNVVRYPEAQTFPGVVILRVDASLYFANMSYLTADLQKRVVHWQDVHWLILDMSGVNDIDVVAIEELEDMVAQYKQTYGIQIIFTNMKGPVRDVVHKAQWEDKLGAYMTSVSIEQALQTGPGIVVQRHA